MVWVLQLLTNSCVNPHNYRTLPVYSKEASPDAESQGAEETSGLATIILEQQQKHLEYEEDDAPEEAVVELKHAALSIPNLPAPRSSDGNVSTNHKASLWLH